jgi:hypothetical protein
MGCAGLTIAGGVLEIAGFALVAYELARIQRREFGEPEFRDVYRKRPNPGSWLHNRKRPSGEEGSFWGYSREERYVSLYMWIRGR